MRRYSFLLLIAGALLLCSAVVYYLHYLIFHDAHHIFIYLVGDVAFVPVEVLLVAIIIERLLSSRDTRAKLEKLNMVIGSFFSEVGTELLGRLTSAMTGRQQLREHLAIGADWTARDFERAIAFAREFPYEVDAGQLDLVALRDMLTKKRDFLLRLLENPNLLEHERFTDLLWAIFHLTEELIARDTLLDLPESDLAHLAGDIQRAHSRLAGECVAYAQHLQSAYPFLFSLVVRTHPLQDHPSARVV